MKHSKKQQILLRRIANHLILNGELLDNVGFFFGKMGVIIFLYHYSRTTNNTIVNEFANQMLSELIADMHDEHPTGIANGYCGIGWSIEYLMHSGFIEGDSNEVLGEVDQKIMERNVVRMNDTRLLSGLEGIFHYVLFRLLRSDETTIPFDQQYLKDLHVVAERLIKKQDNLEITFLASQFLLWKRKRIIDYNPEMLLKVILPNENKIEDISTLNLGLKDGCSGIGLNLIAS